jgi:hypothetical protein
MDELGSFEMDSLVGCSWADVVMDEDVDEGGNCKVSTKEYLSM